MSSCPAKVRSALSELDGVISAETTQTSAVVVLDRDKVTDTQLIDAVRGAGNDFDARVK
ncbi:MAG: heavy-metal-associated domain-containing protein [Akkermansiaceae bacterium]